MIDADRSLSALGTDVSTLTHGSEKRVAAVCEGCGKIRVIRYNAYHALCMPCSKKRCNLSEETLIKMAAAMMGNQRWRGRTHTEESRLKMMGRVVSAETRIKMSEAGKGRKKPPLSKETRRKISETLKGRTSPMKGKTPSEETRQKQSATWQAIPYDEWESYTREQLYCPKFNEACRESNRAKYNHECFLCGKPQAQNVTKTGKVRKLSVHHVDMQKSQGCDSNWKLVPLCLKCHGKAHTKLMTARIEYILAHTSI